MCRRVTCKVCKRPTWAGCGAHVERVLGDVPTNDRCACRSEAHASRTPPQPRRSWLSRLTGR
ncbi:MAG: hypothetical protein ABI706_05370 [Ilumatobacteraceae bacterium]